MMDVVGKILDFLSAFVRPTVFSIGVLALALTLFPNFITAVGFASWGITSGSTGAASLFCALFLGYEPLSKWLVSSTAGFSAKREQTKLKQGLLRLSRKAQTLIHLMLRENADSFSYDPSRPELIELEAGDWIRPVQTHSFGRTYTGTAKLDDVRRNHYGWVVSGLNIDPTTVVEIVAVMNGHSDRI